MNGLGTPCQLAGWLNSITKSSSGLLFRDLSKHAAQINGGDVVCDVGAPRRHVQGRVLTAEESEDVELSETVAA